MCFHFLYKFCVKHLILRRCQKWTLSSCKVLVTLCQILMTLEYSWQTFEKCSNNKFHKNPSNGSHIAPCGWTDRETQTFIKANSCFLPIPVASLSKVWLCGRSLAGIWVRIPPHEWMSASCELTGRGLCVRLFILREESYRVWVCDREDSTMMRPWPTRTGPATLWHTCPQWHAACTAVPIFFYLFCPTSLSKSWSMCIYTHLRRECIWITVATK